MSQLQSNRNGSPVTSTDWSIQALKTVTLNGTTGNGAVGTVPLFTVTGAVLMRLFAKAHRAGMTTAEYAQAKSNAPGILGKQARLAKNLMGLNKK